MCVCRTVQVEKQRDGIQRELETLQEQLEEEGGLKAAQIALNKKREDELQELKVSMEAGATENEKTVSDLKKKHANTVKELEEKLDQLQKNKAKYMRLFIAVKRYLCVENSYLFVVSDWTVRCLLSRERIMTFRGRSRSCRGVVRRWTRS